MDFYGKFNFNNDVGLGKRTNIDLDKCKERDYYKQNAKKFKYYTTNPEDLMNSKEEYNVYSISSKRNSGGCDSNDYKNLEDLKNEMVNLEDKEFRFNPLSKYKGKMNSRRLPLIDQGRRTVGRHNLDMLDVEYNMSEKKKNKESRKHSKLPRDEDYTKRTFPIFGENDCKRPKSVNYVESKENGWVVNRGGVSTRVDSKYM